MAHIFLSKSTQVHNEYTGGSTEAAEMDDVVDLVAPLLRAEGHTVKVGEGKSWQEQVALGNAFMGAHGFYYAIHSNASKGGDGTLALYKPGSNDRSVEGRAMATKLYARVAPVSVGKDDGVKPNDGLGELNGPHSPSCLIELEFHDNAAGAHDIRSRHSAYAHAIAAGILDEVGRKPVAKPKPVASAAAPALSLTISKHNAHRGEGYVLTGILKPTIAGAPIVITYRRPGEELWRKWVTLKTDAKGAYSVGTRGYRIGTYTYRATFPGDATHGVARYAYATVGILK